MASRVIKQGSLQVTTAVVYMGDDDFIADYDAEEDMAEWTQNEHAEAVAKIRPGPAEIGKLTQFCQRSVDAIYEPLGSSPALHAKI
jgi:hypothetical protein